MEQCTYEMSSSPLDALGVTRIARPEGQVRPLCLRLPLRIDRALSASIDLTTAIAIAAEGTSAPVVADPGAEQCIPGYLGDDAGCAHHLVGSVRFLLNCESTKVGLSSQSADQSLLVVLWIPHCSEGFIESETSYAYITTLFTCVYIDMVDDGRLGWRPGTGPDGIQGGNDVVVAELVE